MITSIGEILVDVFIEKDNKTVFPGGAPFNVACNIATFGGKVNFIGSLGMDEYGSFLEEFSSKKPLNCIFSKLEDKDTTQALVTLNNGERSFMFVRGNGADYHLVLSHYDLIKKSKIIHLGSLMLSELAGRDFYNNACHYFKDNSDALISFDVNYRDDIFESEEEAKKIFLSAIKKADIIKFTEEELALLSGSKDVEFALKNLLNPDQIAVVTFGKNGSAFYKDGKLIKAASCIMKPVDTTGAGDAFYSYFLYAFDKGFDLENEEEIINVLKHANLAGALATQKKGAIDVVPSSKELEEKYNHLVLNK